MTVKVEGETKYFTIETAPNHIMPHAVHTFMNLIDNRVWDGSMFIHKVDHVALAPISENISPKKTTVKSLLFPEYSSEWPHEVNTVGFQGRPGGPSIYVNLDDNTDWHGPGGQLQHELVEEADPNFAKVIDGFDVLKRFREINRKAVKEDEVYYSKIERMRWIRN